MKSCVFVNLAADDYHGKGDDISVQLPRVGRGWLAVPWRTWWRTHKHTRHLCCRRWSVHPLSL